MHDDNISNDDHAGDHDNNNVSDDNGVNDDIHWTLWDGVIMYTEHNTHFGIFYQQRVGKGKPLVLQLME